MKSILVAGVAKSGKSSFCNKICNETRYNHIPLDYFTAAMKRNYPEWGIKSDVVINDTSKKLCKLLSTVTSIMNTTDEKYIIDSAHLMPKDIITNIDRNKWDIYFFGYEKANVNDKFNNIRKYESDGWTTKRTDEELKGIIIKLIKISKTIKKECKKYNIKYIDTSVMFNSVLDKEIKNIVNDSYK